VGGLAALLGSNGKLKEEKLDRKISPWEANDPPGGAVQHGSGVRAPVVFSNQRDQPRLANGRSSFLLIGQCKPYAIVASLRDYVKGRT
jgi:hypothetical protein